MSNCIFRLIFAKEIKEIFRRLKQRYEDLLKLYIHKTECYNESLKTINKLQKQIDELEDLINSNSNFLPNEFVAELMQILPSPNILNLTTRETKNLKAVGISMDDVTIFVKPFKSQINIPRKFHEFNYNIDGSAIASCYLLLGYVFYQNTFNERDRNNGAICYCGM